MQVSANIVILSHEHEIAFVNELIEHLKAIDKYLTIYTLFDINADSETIEIITKELNRSHVSLIFISSSLMADDMLTSLREISMELHDANKIETIQVLARSVYDYSPKSKRHIHTIPNSPLSVIKDKDSVYTSLVSFIIDKAELIIVKRDLLLANEKIKKLTEAIEKLIS